MVLWGVESVISEGGVISALEGKHTAKEKISHVTSKNYKIVHQYTGRLYVGIHMYTSISRDIKSNIVALSNTY